MKEITAEYLTSQGLSQTFPQRFWSKVDKNGPVPKHCPDLGPCWVWTGALLTNGGYGEIFGKDSIRAVRANRASWILNVGPIPDGLFILHRCDNPACVRPAHLFLGTPKQNMDDMRQKGRERHKTRKGSENNKAKLTESQVSEIRERYHKGHVGTLSKEFGITKSNVYQIVGGHTWKHI